MWAVVSEAGHFSHVHRTRREVMESFVGRSSKSWKAALMRNYRVARVTVTETK